MLPDGLVEIAVKWRRINGTTKYLIRVYSRKTGRQLKRLVQSDHDHAEAVVRALTPMVFDTKRSTFVRRPVSAA
jgi:hypothetical protein